MRSGRKPGIAGIEGGKVTGNASFSPSCPRLTIGYNDVRQEAPIGAGEVSYVTDQLEGALQHVVVGIKPKEPTDRSRVHDKLVIDVRVTQKRCRHSKCDRLGFLRVEFDASEARQL